PRPPRPGRKLRLRHHPANQNPFPSTVAMDRWHALPDSASPGTQGLDQIALGPIGDRPQAQILLAQTGRPQSRGHPSGAMAQSPLGARRFVGSQTPLTLLNEQPNQLYV